MDRIYLSPPHVLGRERELLLDAFDSNWIAPLGPHVDAFEQEMASVLGGGHAAALSSGTAALHLALILCGVKAGDRVICSDFTFSASANPITYVGATPVFVDCDDETWNLDPDLLEEAIVSLEKEGTPATAVIAVDLYGNPCAFDRIEEICSRHGVVLIEDAAEALGASYQRRMAGRFGRVAALSFNGNKIITTSGGGMLVSDDPELVQRARFLSTQAREAAPHYQHEEIGFNYRMSNLLAAVGRGQLETLPERVARRRATFDRYTRMLRDLDGLAFAPETDGGVSNRWLTCITIDSERFGCTREDVRLALERQNIESRPLWKPMHMQPVFAGARVFGGSVSARLFRDGLCLPSGSSLAGTDQDRIVEIVKTTSAAAARTI